MNTNMNKNNLPKKAAFTLVEMSIVIVIVGMLIAAVMAGQEILESSKRMAVVSSIQKYRTAYDQFTGKYYSPPGDMIDAASVLNASTSTCVANIGNGACNGNGNGTIENGNEQFFAWHHLGKSGFIDGNYTGGASAVIDTTIPSGPFNKSSFYLVYGGLYTTTANFLMFSRVTSGGLVGYPTITASQAYTIDQKMDDISPNTGSLLATGGAPGASCLNVSNAYNTTNKEVTCIIYFKMDNNN